MDKKSRYGKAGISRRSVLGMMGMTIAAAGLGCSSGSRGGASSKLLILGLDGMDHRIVGEMMARGELPNFKRLAEKGSFLPLVSSNPPQSPVAWANFVTGKNPGGHGIFDFIMRNPETYEPYISMSKASQSNSYLKTFNRTMLLTKGDAVLLRKGKAWWNTLEEHGVPATAISVPSNFPPEDTKQRTLSGMGTPDVRGTLGTFSLYTTQKVDWSSVRAGRVYEVKVKDGAVESELLGPKNYQKEGKPDIKVPVKAHIDPAGDSAKIEIQDVELTLKRGEWSGWQKLNFAFTPMNGVSGMIRLYLKSVKPDFTLYISPVNMDPSEPAQTISTPSYYSADLAGDVGPFYTQGIPEEIVAFNEGWLDEDEYLVQAKIALSERLAIFKLELERFSRASEGVYFCYFGTTDTCSHMFWGHRDPKSPIYDTNYSPRYSRVIDGLYHDMDSLVGHALKNVSRKTEVIIMSDHGFAPFYRAFNLNRWLADNGYLAVKDYVEDQSGNFLGNIDWRNTKAYAIGLNSLYINLKGRESKGTVSPGERDAMVKGLIEKLGAVKDPANGESVIHRAYDSSEIYTGRYKGDAPDIVVGYNRGYRASWETTLGKAPKELIRDNDMQWSGDHCMDPAMVPGIFFCSREVDASSVRLEDIASTILAFHGIGTPPDMDGKSLF